VSRLETSITLEEVFALVSAKRVPLAPELAGYLALEIAEGAGQAPGEIDPRTVYIGDEGSVALVRPKRADAPGDAETSLRSILQKLLDASGSQTPALAVAAKRSPGAGIAALVSELEAALIPVNRSAGRRALARLAREVKRVALGVGRNASVPASERGPRASSPSYGSIGKKELAGTPPPSTAASVRAPPDPAVVAAAAAAVAPLRFDAEEVPTTAKRDIPSELLAHATGPEHLAHAPLPTVEVSPADRAPAGDDVDSLLSSFEVSDERADKAIARDLKAMVGLDPTRTPPPAGVRPEDPLDDAGLDSLLAMTGSSPPVASPPKSPPVASPPRSVPSPSPVRAPAPSYAEERALPTFKTKAKTRPLRPNHRPAKTDRLLLVLLVILLVAGAGVLSILKPGFFTGRTPEKIEQERAAREAEKQRAALAAESSKTCKASLAVTAVPEHAEVLLRVGQAPADVQHMPVGARLEFVATAEGHVPKRTVVPVKATWEPGPDGKPRFEVAVQLEPVKIAKPGARGAAAHREADAVPWPQGEPGTDVGGQGPPGTVHVVSTPRGAEIWLLTGMGPEALIEQLPCTGDIDVLVAGPGPYRKRLHLKEADFVTSEGTTGQTIRKAQVSAR
jgi:hypothetical protein